MRVWEFPPKEGRGELEGIADVPLARVALDPGREALVTLRAQHRLHDLEHGVLAVVVRGELADEIELVARRHDAHRRRRAHDHEDALHDQRHLGDDALALLLLEQHVVEGRVLLNKLVEVVHPEVAHDIIDRLLAAHLLRVPHLVGNDGVARQHQRPHARFGIAPPALPGIVAPPHVHHGNPRAAHRGVDAQDAATPGGRRGRWRAPADRIRFRP